MKSSVCRVCVAVLVVSAGLLVNAWAANGNQGGGGGGYVTPTNSWVLSSSDLWQHNAAWSLGILPAYTQQVMIVNAGSKIVTLDAGTVASAPGSLTVLGLTLGNGSTLSLNDPGWATPLYISNSLRIGSGGALTVTNGAVSVSSGLVSDGALLLNAGSLTANGITVGNTGAGSWMVVSNGAQVSGTLYEGSSAGSDVNAVLINGMNSLWTANNANIGGNGNNNQLLINGGGQLHTMYGNLGWNGGINNTVTVSDPASAWINDYDLYVGESSAGNQLIVSNAAQVQANYGYVGAFANNNKALVTGNGSIWTNSGDLQIGGWNASGNEVTINSGAQVANNNAFVGYQASSTSNTVLVTGHNSYWNNSGDINVGYQGSGNQLTISNGALVGGHSGFIGFDSASSNNSVLVTGGQSVWNNSADLYVGNGAGNQLTLADGGQVWVGGTSYVGATAAGSNNFVTVTGAGSTWSNQQDLLVGEYGTGNQLTISTGGRVVNNNGAVGYGTGASNNTVVVFGADALWQNSGNLTVGNGGGGNQLIVAGGGRVVSSTAYVGSADSNSVQVAGANSVWSNSADLYVGEAGGGNQVLATAGASISVGGDLVVGHYGHDTVLRLDNAALAVGGASYIGSDFNAPSNSVVLNGAGASWNTGHAIYIGYNGSGNQLLITNGAQMLDTDAYLGCGWPSHGNSATLAGANSSWQNNGDLSVGSAGSDNQLVVAEGAVLGDHTGYLGRYPGSSNNFAWITGPQAQWLNSGNLEVGSYGAGNQLTIAGGAQVTSVDGYIGRYSGSSNNTVLVTGAGSQWNNSGALFVGHNGWGNTLTISNGGSVSAARLLVASNGVGVVVVDGGSLTATSAPSVIGDSGNGALTVRAGQVQFAAVTLANQAMGDLNISGGSVAINGPLMVGNGTWAYGTVELNGGQLLTTSGPTTLGNYGWSVMNVGGGLWQAQDVTVGANNSGALGVGSYLNISGGSTVMSGSLNVGYNSSGLGTVNITGGDTHVAGTLLVGHAALAGGTVALSGGSLTAGGETIAEAGSGWFTQDNANSSNLVGTLALATQTASLGRYTLNGGLLAAANETIGAAGQGWFLQNGGTNTIAQDLRLGSELGGQGVYVLSAGNLTAHNEYIGDVGVGQISQVGGTNTVSGTLTIGPASGGYGTYEMDGGKIIAGNINIQQHGSFTNLGGNVDCTVLNQGTYVHAGGEFNALLVNQGTFAMTADFAPAEGVINYTSMTIPTNLSLFANGAGFDNRGRLGLAGGTLTGSGLLTNSGDIFGYGVISNQVSNTGTIEASNGTLRLAGSVLNAVGGILTADPGAKLTVDGGLVANPGLILDLKGGTLDNGGHTLTNANLISGSGTFVGSIVNDATIAPGHSPGQLTLTGDLVLGTPSTLAMQLAGDSTNLYDRILVGGLLDFNGTLDVTLLDGFDPVAGDTFDLFNFGAESGAFSATNLPALDAGLAWDTSQLLSKGELSVSAIPEPASCAMLLLAFALFAQRRRRR